MPTMQVFKGWDGKWHLNPCVKTDPPLEDYSNGPTGRVFNLLTGERRVLGGDRICGRDKDPPMKDMCPECFPWVLKFITNDKH